MIKRRHQLFLPLYPLAFEGFDLSDLRLQRGGGVNLLPAEAVLRSQDKTVWTLTNLFGLTDPPGTYELTIEATGSGIADLAGNLLETDESEQWTVNSKLFNNPTNSLDVNADGSVTPIDALIIINALNRNIPSLLPTEPTGDPEVDPPPFYDVNNDGFVSPIDVLQVINFLNAQAAAVAEGEPNDDGLLQPPAALPSVAADRLLATPLSTPVAATASTPSVSADDPAYRQAVGSVLGALARRNQAPRSDATTVDAASLDEGLLDTLAVDLLSR